MSRLLRLHSSLGLVGLYWECKVIGVRWMRFGSLDLWLGEQNMQKVRKENLQKESKRQLPFAEHRLLPGWAVDFISAHSHAEKGIRRSVSTSWNPKLAQKMMPFPKITQPAGDRTRPPVLFCLF